MPNVREVAERLDRSEPYVRRLAQHGAFIAAIKRPTRFGGWWIPTAAVEHYQRTQENARCP